MDEDALISPINAQLHRREKEFEIGEDSRINTVWHEALSSWHSIFKEIVELTELSPVTQKELLELIAWAKKESMKKFGISKQFKDPESRWFFAVCEDILEPLAWRLARLEKQRNRKIISFRPRRRTAKIIQMPTKSDA